MRLALIRLGIVALTVVVFALALEGLGAFRAARGGCRHARPLLWRPQPIVGWALVAGTRADVPVCAADRELVRHTIAINALGQRDRPRRLERIAGRSRVLVLGDSFVEAVQVDLSETFASRLEDDLGIEMLNAGVSGYSTDNELRAFVSRGRQYRPDAVLLVFFVGNDVLENGARLYLANPHGLPPKPWLRAPHPSRWLSSCLTVHRAAARAAASVPDLAWRSSRVLRFGLAGGVEAVLGAACGPALGPSLIPGVPELMGVYGAPATPAWEEAWDETDRLLVRLARRVRHANARFGVVLAPAAFEYDPRLAGFGMTSTPAADRTWDHDYPYRRVTALLEREGVPVLSLVPAFRAHLAATRRCGCYPSELHWDAEGHAVVADQLRAFVGDLVR